jgi:hypothetical protein
VSALFAGAVCASAVAMQIERMLAAIAAVIDFCMTYSLWTVARIERSEIRGSLAAESWVSLRSTQATIYLPVRASEFTQPCMRFLALAMSSFENQSSGFTLSTG